MNDALTIDKLPEVLEPLGGSPLVPLLDWWLLDDPDELE